MDKHAISALLTIVTVLAWGAPAIGANGQGQADRNEENPHLWKPCATSVAVFKNGLGFFMREGDVELRDGWCMASKVPPAAFGTLAIYSLNKDETVDIVGSGPGEVVDFDGKDAPKDAAAKRARLRACKNVNLLLTYKHKGSKRQATGKLISVGKEFVVLENQNNSFAVPVDGITRMQILDLPVRVHVAGPKGNAPKKTKLGMAYLRKGITWIPEYTVEVLDETTARLTLRGTLVNEAEDLIHCDVHFVVGVPHFKHTEYLAPIAVGQIIRTIGAAVAPRQIATQIMNRAAITSNLRTAGQFDRGAGVVDRRVRPEGGNLAAAVGNLPKMGGAAGTDYTVYTKKNLTIRRGEKAIVTLFVKKIRYSHVYRWSPPKRLGHSLVLHNTTDTAWTTGPALVVSKERPLSEDLLKYTPRGGDGEIPVTAAINIAHKKSEFEIDRKLKAHSPSHNVYLDLVTLRGQLKIRNFEKRTADLIITVNVPGRPLLASDAGEMTIDSTKLRLLERSGSVRWRIKLEPGETKDISYKYERYVRSY